MTEFVFLDELFLYTAKPKNHGQGTESVLLSKVRVSQMKPQQQFQCNMRVPFGTRNKCKYLFLEMRVLLKITVYFKTMVPRVCHHNVAV